MRAEDCIREKCFCYLRCKEWLAKYSYSKTDLYVDRLVDAILIPT